MKLVFEIITGVGTHTDINTHSVQNNMMQNCFFNLLTFSEQL